MITIETLQIMDKPHLMSGIFDTCFVRHQEMSTKLKINDLYSSERFPIVPAVDRLIKCLQNIGKEVKVEVCKKDHLFWMTEEERENEFGANGPIGTFGCKGPTESKNHKDDEVSKPFASPDDLQITIEFTMLEMVAKEIEKWIPPIELTKNEKGKSLQIFEFLPEKKWVYVAKGIYKKPGFDEAYSALSKVIEITESEFVSSHEDIVEKSFYHGMKDLYREEDDCEEILTGYTEVRMHLLCTDLARNIEQICFFFQDVINVHIAEKYDKYNY